MNKNINKIAETEEEHSIFSEPQNAVRVKQSVRRDPDSKIDLEPDINLVRELNARKDTWSTM